jgi:hypothetical protein
MTRQKNRQKHSQNTPSRGWQKNFISLRLLRVPAQLSRADMALLRFSTFIRAALATVVLLAGAAHAQDAILTASDGCVASPMPQAPADAAVVRLRAFGSATGTEFDVAYWFQPCTRTPNTHPYGKVLLAQFSPVTGSSTATSSSFTSSSFAVISQDGQQDTQFLALDFTGNSSTTLGNGKTVFLIRWNSRRNNTLAINNARPVSVLFGATTKVPVIGAIPTTAGAGPVIPATNYAGVFFNPAENGQGYVLNQDSANKTFFTWYGYADSGAALWYVGVNLRWTATDTLEGDLLYTQHNGPNPLTGTFNGATIGFATLGTVKFKFTDVNNGVVTYRLPDGRAFIKPVTRFPFQ